MDIREFTKAEENFSGKISDKIIKVMGERKTLDYLTPFQLSQLVTALEHDINTLIHSSK